MAAAEFTVRSWFFIGQVEIQMGELRIRDVPGIIRCAFSVRIGKIVAAIEYDPVRVG